MSPSKLRLMERDAADLAAVVMWQHREIEALKERITHNERLLWPLNETIEEAGGTPTRMADPYNYLNRAEKVMRRRNWRIHVH